MESNPGALSGGEHCGGPTRTQAVPARQVLDAVLWILDTGAQWHMLPQYYPNYKTVHRRFQQWCWNEVLAQCSH